MNNRFLKIAGFLCLTFIASVTYSQDVPLGALPMQFNSSFAGEAEAARFSTNGFYFTGRNVPSNIGLAYSYDQFVPALRTGIGIMAGHSHDLRLVREGFYYGGIAVAPKFSIKGKWTISPSIDLQYLYLNSDFRPFQDVASRAGILFNTNKFYVGYSLYIYDNSRINEGDYFRFFNNSIGNLGQLEIDATHFRGFTSHLQMGYTFQRSAESKFSFTSQILIGIRDYAYRYKLFNREGRSFDLDKFIFTFRHSNFLWGVSDVGPHIGWQGSRLRVMAFNNLQRYARSNDHQKMISNLSVRYVLNNN